MTITVGFRVSIGIVRRHKDAPESRDEGGAGEDDQEELVQDPGYLPPLLADDLPPLLSLVPLLHNDCAEVLPWILLLPLLKHENLINHNLSIKNRLSRHTIKTCAI